MTDLFASQQVKTKVSVKHISQSIVRFDSSDTFTRQKQIERDKTVNITATGSV